MVSGNNDDYNEWPTLQTKLTAQAYLYASNGKVICSVLPDGTKHWNDGMEDAAVDRWESFGVTDPIEQLQLEDEVNKLINRFSNQK